MRNNFDSKASNGSGAARRGDQPFESKASSPDQMAVVWNASGEVVAASPASGALAGSYDMDLTRLPADFNLTAALNLRRENHLGVPPLSARTLFLTAIPNFAERTRILALDGNILALSDDELAEWLVEAERQMFLGTDSHPVFETALEDTACSIARLPNGLVAMTEVPRQYVEAARDKVRQLTGNGVPAPLSVAVETPLRSAARYFLTALPEGAVALRPDKETEVTAFLLIGKAGFSYGLWSPQAGLFSEYAFLAPTELNQTARSWGSKSESNYETAARGVRVDDRSPESASVEELELAARDNQLETYVKQAFDQLFLQLSQEKLEQLQLSSYARVVWTAETGLGETVSRLAAGYAAETGLDFFQIGVPVDEAVAGGLLFGSFNFGDDAVAGAEILPPVNLARDLLVLADKEEIERRRLEESYLLKRRNNAIFALVAAPVIMLACLLAVFADVIRTQVMLAVRDARAETRKQELKPALDRRNSYEANLKWYQEFIKQVSSLRRQQPVGIGMLYQLNPNYPFNIDPAFYVSELKLLANSGVEIKGLARNKDAVTSFIRSLEFAGGPESGTKLFSNLTYEVQEGVAQTGAQPAAPAIAGSTLTANSLAPGVISWSIKGNYVPMEAFVPPDPNKKPAPNQPGAAPNAAAPNAAAPNPAAPVPAVPKANP